MRNFGELLELTCDALERIFAKPVLFLPNTAIPGIHIFDRRANGVEGHIHVDEPFKQIPWPCSVADPFSFTVLLESPGEAGINFYPTIDAGWFEDYDAGKNVDVPDPIYCPYAVGDLVWHDGLVPHQIANPVEMGDNDYRITLQGHGVTLENGQIAVYF